MTVRPMDRLSAGVTRPLGRYETVAVVAREELHRLWRNGAFWSSTLLTLFIICAVVAVPALTGGEDRADLGVVGDQPRLTAVLAEHANLVHYPDSGAAEVAVRDGEIQAVVLPGDEVLVDRSLPEDLERLLLWAHLAAADPTGEVGGGTPLRVTVLAEDADRLQQRTLAAIGGVLILGLLMMLFGYAVAQNVAEEKSSRIVELLLAKLRPWQLLAGKIIGMSLAALTQVLATMAVVYGVAVAAGVLVAPLEALGVGLSLLLWFVPAFVMFTTGYAVAGALVSRPEDVGHVTGPMMVLQVLCMVGPLLVVSGADQALVTAASIVPGFSWATMPVRMAYFGAPWWQAAVAYLLMLFTIVALLRLGERAYRGSILQFGGVVSIRQALSSASPRDKS